MRENYNIFSCFGNPNEVVPENGRKLGYLIQFQKPWLMSENARKQHYIKFWKPWPYNASEGKESELKFLKSLWGLGKASRRNRVFVPARQAT
jgi:hypothetical protein